MKLLIIGIGNCGSRIADEFIRLNKRAKAERNVNLTAGVYAVNSNQASLAALTAESSLHRILISSSHTVGQGIVETSQLGAELAREEGDRVITAIRASGGFFETDAFLLIAGAAGSIGSGGMPVIAQMLKENYAGKPTYALVVLPFDSEEVTNSRCVYNTAICLKSIHKAADAVFLVDNQRFGKVEITQVEHLEAINKDIVATFYDLLCASEVTDPKLMGARTLGVGDIIQTLAGWTVIGVGRSKLPSFKHGWGKLPAFQEKGTETLKAVEAMNSALGALSTSCNAEDAGRALYLLCAPSKEANIDMAKALGNHLWELTHSAEIIGGDFSGERDMIAVTVILSQLAYVERVRDYYDKAVSLVKGMKRKRKVK